MLKAHQWKVQLIGTSYKRSYANLWVNATIVTQNLL